MRFWIVAVVVIVACGHPPTDPIPARPITPADAPLADAPAIADAPSEPVAAICEPFDLKNPACMTDPRVCQHGFDCKCPSPPDAENPACWAVMPCPSPPDHRIKACIPPPPTCADPANPHCPPPPVVVARVIQFKAITDDEAAISIAIGTDAGVSMRWSATLLRGESEDALPGGEITIVRVTKRITIGKVRIREAGVLANPRGACTGDPLAVHNVEVTRDDILRGIEQAFAKVRMPKRPDDVAEPGIEAPYVIEHFHGKTQAEVEADFPASLYMEDFTYMVPAAALYYLPSVLRIMLASGDDEDWIYVHSFLDRIDGKYPRAVLVNLTKAQRKAVADWAEHLAETWAAREWMAGCAKEAAALARKYR